MAVFLLEHKPPASVAAAAAVAAARSTGIELFALPSSSLHKVYHSLRQQSVRSRCQLHHVYQQLVVVRLNSGAQEAIQRSTESLSRFLAISSFHRYYFADPLRHMPSSLHHAQGQWLLRDGTFLKDISRRRRCIDRRTH